MVEVAGVGELGWAWRFFIRKDFVREDTGREEGQSGAVAAVVFWEIRLRSHRIVLKPTLPGSRHFRFSAMSAVTMLPPPVQEPVGALRSTPVSRYMKSDLIDKAAKVIPHPPILINLVSRRVRQLNQGRAPLINTANYGPRLGQGDIALLEIIEGLISAEMLNTPDGGVAAG